MKVVIAGSRNVQVLNLEAEKSFSPPGSKSTSLYCGSIFDPPSKRKKPPQTLRLAGFSGAGNVTRTHDLLITNHNMAIYHTDFSRFHAVFDAVKLL